MFITIIVFLLILSVLVLIHEAGHFITAKLFGIKVEEFGFGFPLTKPLFSIKKGETTYSFYPALIGGFVKLYGEDEAGAGRVNIQNQSFSMKKEEIKISSGGTTIEEEDIEISRKLTLDKKQGDLSRAFFARPIWQRAIVIFAGVFMNFVLAVAIISFLFSFVGVQIPGDKVIVNAVVKNSPAEKAGLKTGDMLISIDGQKVIDTQKVISYTKDHLGKQIALEVVTSKNLKQSLTITPRKTYPSNEGAMGVAISQNVVVKKYPWYQAPFVGTWEALKETWLIADGLVMLVAQAFTKGAIPQGVAGPVGIAQLTGIAIQLGPSTVLSLISLLSLNLAIVNILPIPALDGGRLLFIVIEGVFRRKVDQRIEGYAHAIGMAILLGLIALITIHDLIRVLTGQPIIPK